MAEYSIKINGVEEGIVEITALKKELDRLDYVFDDVSKGVDKFTNHSKGMLNLLKAGTGIVSLFCGESEKSKKIMDNIGKTLAIVNSLQEVNNLLLKKAAGLEAVRAVQTMAASKVIALSTQNTIAATVAQKALNLVAKANPYLLLATGAILLVGVLAKLFSATEEQTDAQKNLNTAVENSIELKDKYANKIKTLANANTNQMQRELDLMKAKGASEAMIAKKGKEIYEERLKSAEKMASYYKEEIAAIDENSKRVDQYTKELISLDQELYSGKLKNMEEYNSKREDILQKMAITNARLAQGVEAKENLQKAQNDLDKHNADIAKKGAELEKKNASARAALRKRDAIAESEYRVLIAQKGSEEELKAQINAANQQLRNDLDNTDITNNERLKRTEETLVKIEKLEEEYRKRQHNKTIALIDARLSLLKKGSLEEYTLQLERLKKQNEIDLDNAELTIEERKKIESKYRADVDKISNDYDNARIKMEIDTNISTINTRLASVKKGSQEELDLEIKLAEEKANIAKREIENTINNEALKAARIKEINEKLNKDKEKLTLDKQVSDIESTSQKETLAITKEYENRIISKRAYEDAMLNISIKALEDEINARKKCGEDTSIMETELSNLRQTQAEKEKNRHAEHWSEIAAQTQKYADAIMEGVNAIFSAANDLLKGQLEDANEKLSEITTQYDEVVKKREESNDKIQSLEEEAKNARGGRALVLQEQIRQEIEANQQLANQEKTLAKDKEKQEKEVAKKEKQQKRTELAQNIIQGIANTAMGATKAWSYGPILGPILAAIVAAAGAIQVGVMTKQLAKLENGGLLNGKRHSQGGMRIEGSNIEVEGGEYVVNRESTSKNLGLVRYINAERRELKPTDLNAFFARSSRGFEPSFSRMFQNGGQLPMAEPTANIDNETLVQAIRSIRIEPRVAVSDIHRVQDSMVSVDSWTGV